MRLLPGLRHGPRRGSLRLSPDLPAGFGKQANERGMEARDGKGTEGERKEWDSRRREGMEFRGDLWEGIVTWNGKG